MIFVVAMLTGGVILFCGFGSIVGSIVGLSVLGNNLEAEFEQIGRELEAERLEIEKQATEVGEDQQGEGEAAGE